MLSGWYLCLCFLSALPSPRDTRHFQLLLARFLNARYVFFSFPFSDTGTVVMGMAVNAQARAMISTACSATAFTSYASAALAIRSQVRQLLSSNHITTGRGCHSRRPSSCPHFFSPTTMNFFSLPGPTQHRTTASTAKTTTSSRSTAADAITITVFPTKDRSQGTQRDTLLSSHRVITAAP